jgi:hypothetical protein
LAKERCCPSGKCNNSATVNKDGTMFTHPDEQCKDGYSGALCLVCRKGYVQQGNSCIECKAGASIGVAALPLIAMLVGLFCLLLIYFILGKKASSNAEKGYQWFGQAKIMLSFVQIFSSMPGVLDGVPWPKLFLEFALPLNIANLDILAILASSGCSLNVRYYDKFILHMMLLIGCIVVVGLSYCIAVKCCIKKDDTEKQLHAKEMASKATILLILLLYPGIATYVYLCSVLFIFLFSISNTTNKQHTCQLTCTPGTHCFPFSVLFLFTAKYLPYSNARKFKALKIFCWLQTTSKYVL